MKILLFFLFPLLLYSSNYPTFSKDELIEIEKDFSIISKNRILDYEKKVSQFKTYKKQKQLSSVNFYLNQLLPQYDEVTKNQEDYWATPKEFLAVGYGDCEDYAIIKYFTLLKLGFDKEKLFLTTVYELYTGSYHMVLSYFTDGERASPLILDNLSFKILNLKTRVDLKADMFINHNGIYKIDKSNRLTKISLFSVEFNNLLKRVKNNH